MKPRLWRIWGWVWAAALLVGCTVESAEKAGAGGVGIAATNSAAGKVPLLAIHLVTKVKQAEGAGGEDFRFKAPPLNLVEVDPKPVLADSDFVSFDFKKQEFVITAAAAERLSKANWGTNRQTFLNEGRYEFLPFPQLFVVKAEGVGIYAGSFTTPTSSVMFFGPTILAHEFFLMKGESKAQTLRIEYPAELGKGDPRRDPRIAAAVGKLLP